MLENCRKCGAILCDCPPPQVETVKPATIIDFAAAENRCEHIRLIIEMITSGRVSTEDARKFYKQSQKEIREEIRLLKILATHVNPAMEKMSMDDFPLK